MLIQNNAESGFDGYNCTVTAVRSTFKSNRRPFASTSSTATIVDRCLIVQNQQGLILDAGSFTITNNVIARNYHPTQPVAGIDIYISTPGSRVEFNTIADNADGGAQESVGIACNVQQITASFPNNLIVRHEFSTTGTTCTYPGSIIVDSDISPLKFKSPDAAPYDYHLQAGSIAIDAATISTLDHDFDGDARPQGMQRDVGADEFVP